jgi:hypothetical protein
VERLPRVKDILGLTSQILNAFRDNNEKRSWVDSYSQSITVYRYLTALGRRATTSGKSCTDDVSCGEGKEASVPTVKRTRLAPVA